MTHPHSGRLFVGFLAGALFSFLHGFWAKTADLMIFHQKSRKLTVK